MNEIKHRYPYWTERKVQKANRQCYEFYSRDYFRFHFANSSRFFRHRTSGVCVVYPGCYTLVDGAAAWRMRLKTFGFEVAIRPFRRSNTVTTKEYLSRVAARVETDAEKRNLGQMCHALVCRRTEPAESIPCPLISLELSDTESWNFTQI